MHCVDFFLFFQFQFLHPMVRQKRHLPKSRQVLVLSLLCVHTCNGPTM